jgi:hypothetical protein
VSSEVNSRPKQLLATETSDKKLASASHNHKKPDSKQTNHKTAAASSPITPNPPPSAKSGSAEASSAKGSNKPTAHAHSTGAIPKQRAPLKGPAVANHLLDEITSVPLDDDGAPAAVATNRHKVKHSMQKQQQ